MVRLISIILFLVICYSCTTNDLPNSEESEWLVDRNDVTGQLNLFALSNQPKFKSVSEVNLADGDLVALVKIGNEVRVYPYIFTNPFEVINDVLNHTNIAVSYCPITKSGICFSRNINGAVSNFRASGYLYNNNLMPYDEETETIWSQMRQQAVFGSLKGTKLKTFNLIETKWSTIKSSFSSARVFVSDKNGIIKNKDITDKGENDSNGEGAPEDNNFVYGVFYNGSSDNLGIFEYNQFEGTKVYDLTVGNRNIIVVGDASRRIISSYFTGSKGQFEELAGEFPLVMVNKENGSKYNIFGKAISGPDAGVQLESPRSFVAIWWAWKEFYNRFLFNIIEE